jgi:hypothetical protein
MSRQASDWDDWQPDGLEDDGLPSDPDMTQSRRSRAQRAVSEDSGERVSSKRSGVKAASAAGRAKPRARLRWNDERDTQQDETREEWREEPRDDAWDDDGDGEWDEGASVPDPSLPLDAVYDGAPLSAEDSGPIPPPRALVRARPVTRQDTALVRRTSQKLGTLQPTDKQLAALSPTSQTALIPAAKNARPTAIVPAVVLRGSEPRPRSRTATIIVSVVALALLFGAVRVVIPLTAQKAVAQIFSPNGALLALDPANAPPSGPWDTSSGAAEALGQGGGAGPGVNAPGSAGAPIGDTGPAGNYHDSPGAVFVSPPPMEPWPPGDVFGVVPGHPAFRVNRPADGYYWWAFGQCTWWAQNTRRDENLSYIGDAKYWAAGAAARGYRVGTQPAVNSTVMLRPGVEGAGGAGHVAHVEAVYPGGWFLISEMNFYWNGGGWGRVDYRFAHSGPGVYFIY